MDFLVKFNFPSLDENVKMLLKKVQCRYPGYPQVKFCSKLTDTRGMFFSNFWPLGRPLGRGETFFGTNVFCLDKHI